eukprot:Skav232800  [mRNA]  locus=scaffold614:327706:330255:- [translate_table: standard]
MVEVLLEAKAELDGPGNGGGTPLHMAVHTGRSIMVKQLLILRANPEVLCNRGLTAMQKAQEKGRRDVIKVIEESRSEAVTFGQAVRQRSVHQDSQLPEMFVPEKLTIHNELQEPQVVWTNQYDAEAVFVATETLALRHAFVVTNRKYSPERKDLEHTIEPGRKLQRALLRSCFEVVLLEDGIEEEFWGSLKELERSVSMQPQLEHLVFFYFAGHGAEQGGELWMMMRDSSKGISLSQVLHRLLVAPKVAVLAVPDCCRENSPNEIFRAPVERCEAGARSAGAFGFRTADPAICNEDLAQVSTPTDPTTSNFYILWAGDKGTCIRDRVEDSMGYQIASNLFASPGISLTEILKLASEQVKLHRSAAGELQRPWSECGVGQTLGRRVIRPLLCKRCDSLRKKSRSHGRAENGMNGMSGMESQGQGLLTAEHFDTMLSSPCGSWEHCALAALNTLEVKFCEELDDLKRWAPLRAFFCAAVRANSVGVIQFMAHLHPELLSTRGFDAFENANYYGRGIPSPSSLRQTPVLAVAAGPREAVDALIFLLQAKANLQARDLEGWTAHQHAAYFGNFRTLKILLGASSPGPDLKSWSLSPLHLAAAQGHQECVELMLEVRSELDAIPPGWALNDVQTNSVTHADPKKVWYQRSLLERLGRAASQKPLGGLTALHLAAVSGYAGCVAALLRAGADPTACGESGFCPLQLCVKKWNLPQQQRIGHAARNIDFAGVFDELVGAGARDILPEKMETSLHAVAFHWGNASPAQTRLIGLRLIQEAQSQIDAPGPKGGTPLHFAVNGRNWAMCSLLLERRADPSLRNDVDRAVWELPVLQETGNWECCSILLKLRDQHEGPVT